MTYETRQKSPSQRIIDAMGGIRPAAKRLSKSPSTVQYWYDEGIPQRHQQLVLDTCRDENVAIDGAPISPADFFEAPPPDRESSDRIAS